MGGPGHGDHAPVMTQGIGEAVLGEFSPDLIAGAAHAGTLGAAALDHEAGYDPVEQQAVVKALGNQGLKVAHRVGGGGGVQLQLDNAAVFHFNYYHGMLSFFSAAGLRQFFMEA